MKKMLIAVVTFALLLTLSIVMVGCGGLSLDAPTNVKYDGTTITWNSVEGADLYTVTIGEKEYTVSTNRYSYNANGKEFTVKIKPSSKVSEILSADEAIQTFIPLSKIETLNVNAEGEVSWNVVDGATSYQIKIDNGEPIEQVETSFSSMPEGTHSIQVKPIVSGDSSYYSYWSNAKSITKLGKLNASDITYSNVERKISWKAVTGAQYYEVMINGVVIGSNYTTTSCMYEADNSNFEVSVRAIGNGSTTFNGAVSENRKFIFLSTVSNIYVDDGALKWEPVNGADGYRIKQNGVIRPEVFTACEMANLPANISLRFEILPISNDSAYFSDWSTEKAVFVLSAPVLAWNDAMEHEGSAMRSITWDGVSSATGYTARVTTPDGMVNVYNLPETQRFYENAYTTAGEYKIEIKATSAVADKEDSKYSNPIIVKRLEAPKPNDTNYIVSDVNDVQKGFTVTFKSVSGAKSYRLFKEGNLVQDHQATQFNVTDVVDEGVITEQAYIYKVQAVGADVQKINGTTYATISSLSSESLSFDIKVLAQPSTPNIDGFTYTYGEISNANGYVVAVGGEKYISGSTSYNLSDMEAGSFPVSVCAKGNGSNILSSNYTAPIIVNRLEAPSNVRIDTSDASDGSLTWDPVNAPSDEIASYKIVFNNDGNLVPAEQMMNINQFITTEGTTVYMQTVANCFNEDKTIYYMTSKPGLTTQFVKLDVPKFGDVKFNNNQLIWNVPDNVKGSDADITYRVYTTNNVYTGNYNGTSLDISDLVGGQSYTFYVKAIGNGTKYINSEKTEGVTIHKLATPEVKREGNKYVWNRVTNAQSYVIYIDGVIAETYDHLDGTTAKYYHTPLFNKLGTYSIKVVAVGDGGYTSIDSDPYEFTQEVKQLTTPEFSVSYSEPTYSTTGAIIVNITKPSYYADGNESTGSYAYFISGTRKTSGELTCSHVPNSAGKHSVAVYACGGTFDENGVYYIDSQTAGSKVETAINLLHVPNSNSIEMTMDGYLQWATISNAVKYELEFAINGGEYEEVVTVNTMGYDFYSNYMEDGQTVNTLKVRIRAIGNGANIVSSLAVEKQFDNQNFVK